MPYIKPENLAPAQRRCARFFIPVDEYHEAAFWGAIQELLYGHNWEGTKEDKSTLTALWENIISEAREEYVAGGCDQVSDAVVGISFDAETNSIEYTTADGQTVVTGITAGCCYEPPLSINDEPPSDAFGSLCSAVNGMIDKEIALWSDLIDEIDLAKQKVKLVADAAIAWMEVATFSIAEMLPLDELAAFMWGSIEISLNELRADTTSESFLDEIKEDLYCRLRNREDKSLTEEVYEEWLNNDVEPTSVNGIVVANYLRHVVKYHNAARLFFAYSKDTSSSCEELYACGQPTGCAIWPSGSGWQLHVGTPDGGDPLRINTQDNGANHDLITLEYTFPQARMVTSVKMEMNKLNAPISQNTFAIQLYYNNQYNQIYSYSGNDGSWSYWWNLDGNVVGNWAGVTKVLISLDMYQTEGLMALRNIEICSEVI